jgi:hypothetical protein
MSGVSPTGRRYRLFEGDICYEILATLDALGQEDIAGGGNGDNMGVLAERLERNGVMDLS